MNKRINITKKLRFEVFKRDSFTCQYCGRKAPSVVLNVDHINPVKHGGKNDILNLITSCFDCNSGKKDRLLSDKSVVEKQQLQLEEINEKRQQMQMMLIWRDELNKLETTQIEVIINAINSHMRKFSVKESFASTAKSYLKKYTLEQVLDAIEISANKYLISDKKEDSENYINKISGIAKNLSLPIVEQKINFMSSYLSKDFEKQFWQVKALLKDYCNALKTYWNYTDEQIIKDLDTEVNPNSKKCYSYYQFSKLINGWIDEIKSK